MLNRVFSPDPAKVEHARRLVVAFEEGLRRGTAPVSLDRKMVDIPVDKRVEVILARAPACGERQPPPRRPFRVPQPCLASRSAQRA